MGSEIPTEEAVIVNSKLSEDAKQNLQARLGEYKAMLSASPQDSNSLEGAAVTLAELGEFTRAASLLEDLIMKKPNDPDAFRLLGEIKYQLRDYEGSAAAYRRSAMVSKTINFDVLRGLTNALLVVKKPDEAVQVLLASCECLIAEMSNDLTITTDGDSSEKESQLVDPIQIQRWMIVFV
ncbi:uncharacterized protein LOC131332443 isoform X3 [Rhododendron vialii]|uniref:uncharacterized protein LOC131332443 isoform X3 n=1 Tax=Rhododendron vialii TaxID=182163 RepID=UPI002660300A|nr:uncharacterized protein LOC131332443 isoform X3 [Rhododendron vialii]